MSEHYLMGVDIGTQGTKAVVVSPKGDILGSGLVEYEVDQPSPSWAEQWPEVWEGATYRSIDFALEDAGTDPETILGISISGLYGGSGIPVDDEVNPIHPCLIWMDRRATKEVEWIKNNINMDWLFDITGNYVDSYYGYPKMLWIKNNRPKVWGNIWKFIPPSSYIEYKMTGELAVDYSSAGNIGGIFNLEELRWSKEACKELGIPIDYMPEKLVPSDRIIGETQPTIAEKCSLPVGTPVIAGGIDAPMAALSAGAIEEGDNVSMMGTSTCWGTIHQGSSLSKKLVSMPHVASSSQEVYTFGGSATTGALVNWFKNQFGQAEVEASKSTGINPFKLLDMQATNLPPGSKGLLALPYFKGERSPIWDPKARGNVLGLTLFHQKEHIFRSLLEASGYSLRHNLEVGKDIGIPIKNKTSVVGGVSKSDLWVQILADITGQNMVIPAGGVGAPLADAFLAGIATGVVKDYSAIQEWTIKDQVVCPNPTNHEIYNEYYRLYKDLYDSNKEIMHELADLQRRQRNG